MTENRYTQETAPYWRVRPTPFYDTVFLNGTYTADILGCNWTCDQCWSGYGWRGGESQIPRGKGGGVFSPEQIVTKLIEGMKRNAMPAARISGGEASLYWHPHMRLVIDDFLKRTAGKRMVVDGATGPHGDPLVLVIETHGATLTINDLKELEDEYGEDSARIVLALGIKATSAELLSKLTGATALTGKRFHDRQYENLRWLATRSAHLGWFANFLDPFTDPDDLAKLQRELEIKRPGVGRLLGSGPFNRNRYGSSKRYTPKRFRTEGAHFNEPGDVQDEEILMDEENPPTEPQPAHDPDVEVPPHVEVMREFAEATADLPVGQVA